jgi:hypothetical protein
MRTISIAAPRPRRAGRSTTDCTARRTPGLDGLMPWAPPPPPLLLLLLLLPSSASSTGPGPSGLPAALQVASSPRTQVRVFQADNFKLSGMNFLLVSPNGTEMSSWQNIAFSHMTKWLFDMPASSQVTMVAETKKSPHGITINTSTSFPLLPGGPIYICAVPAPDLMSPCELTLERFCGENRTARQCEACAGAHQRQCRAAGCYQEEIEDFCRVGPTHFDLVTISASFTPLAHPSSEANVACANLAPSFPTIEILIGGTSIGAGLDFREGQPYKTIAASATVKGSTQLIEAVRPPGIHSEVSEPLAKMNMKIVAGRSYHIFLVETAGGKPELNWGDDLE